MDNSGTARGIYYTRHGKKRYAVATKEVVLSAGSINSAQLLMLSGIGPANHLKSIGVKVITAASILRKYMAMDFP